jgi:hypothetical protein
MPQDIRSYSSPLASGRLLIKPKVNTSENSPVVDIVRDLSPARIVEHDVRRGGIRKCDRVSTFAEQMLQNTASGRTETSVS